MCHTCTCSSANLEGVGVADLDTFPRKNTSGDRFPKNLVLTPTPSRSNSIPWVQWVVGRCTLLQLSERWTCHIRRVSRMNFAAPDANLGGEWGFILVLLFSLPLFLEESRPRGYKLFSCSTQLSTKFTLLIKTEIPTNKEVPGFESLRSYIYHANKC